MLYRDFSDCCRPTHRKKCISWERISIELDRKEKKKGTDKAEFLCIKSLLSSSTPKATRSASGKLKTTNGCLIRECEFAAMKTISEEEMITIHRFKRRSSYRSRPGSMTI